MSIEHTPGCLQDLADRYLRREMSGEEEMEWEEHYLGCSVCLRVLEETSLVVGIVRDEARLTNAWEGKPSVDWLSQVRAFFGALINPPILQPALAAAAALVIVGIPALLGWQRVGMLQEQVAVLQGEIGALQETKHQLQLPSIPRASYTLHGAYRGADAESPQTVTTVVLPPEGPVVLRFTASQPPVSDSVYRARITGASGGEVWSIDDLRPMGRIPAFTVYCPAGSLQSGEYELHLEETRSSDGEVLSRAAYPFVVVSNGD